jgi:MoxR-like ATPase
MSDVQAVDRLKKAYDTVQRQIRRVVIGQDEVVEQVLISIFARGHVLLVGVPGLAKTLLVSSLASSLSLSFARIQFTPDLMPADITGTEVIADDPATGERKFKFLTGPLFHHIVLADEINRTPPKTQAALLEAMQERSVSIGGISHKLPDPFFVLATQNPIELEGTYPLPEAQLDRFLFNTILDYLSVEEEMQVLEYTTTTRTDQPDAVTNVAELLQFHELVRMVPIADSVARYAVDLIRATRPTDPSAPDFVKKYVNFGASVRAAQFIVLASKARALMKRRYHVTYEDVRALATPVLRHRILLNFHAESDRLTQDDILRRLLEWKPAPRGD